VISVKSGSIQSEILFFHRTLLKNTGRGETLPGGSPSGSYYKEEKAFFQCQSFEYFRHGASNLMKAQGKNPSVLDLILCNVLGIHNRRLHSLTGAVHYCSRCGTVTRDNRKHWLKVTNVFRFLKGNRVIFGADGQEFQGKVVDIDYAAGKIALSHVIALPKWRTKLDSSVRAIHRPWGN